MQPELVRLRADVAAVHLESATCLPTIPACLVAHPEGEGDRLWYLRAEPDVPVYPAAGYTRDTVMKSTGSLGACDTRPGLPDAPACSHHCRQP